MNESLNFLRPYLRGWSVILSAMVVAFLIANKYLSYVTPMYESTAKLRLADMNEGIPNSNLFKDLDVFANTQKINAEIELLKSHSLLSKALQKVPFNIQVFRSGSVRKTELYDDSPFIITLLFWPKNLEDKMISLNMNQDQSFSLSFDGLEAIEGELGDTLKFDDALMVIQLNKDLIDEKKNLQIAGNYLFSILSKAKQINIINSHLDIIAVDKDVPVIRISFKSSHPSKAADFPNALAKAYIEDYIENKYSAANITVKFLNERIAEISKKLDESEQLILKYRDNKNITNLRQETETELRKISQLKIQQTNLKMSLEAIKELENYIQTGKGNFLELAPNFEAFTDLLSTEIIKKIKQLQAEKKDLLLKYTEKDEKVIVVDAKIYDLTSYLEESISNTRKNLETKYEKLVNDINEAEKIFKDVPEKERMMTILNREFEIFQQSYNFLNQKKIEAEIAKAAKIAFHRVITPASKSKDPVSPNKIIIKIVSVILGMMSAVIAIFLVHSLKGRVNNVNTIESQSLIPVLTAIPKLKSETEKELFFVKTLNDWEIKGLLKEKSLICFTGFDRFHGADFLVKELAQVIQMQKRSVLLLSIEQEENQRSLSMIKEQFSENLIKNETISFEQIKTFTLKSWQKMLLEKTENNDFTFLLNSDFGASHTLAGMSCAHLNIVCLDSRLTPAKRITDVDLIQQEYKMPQVFFALNRAGYNPSFIREASKFILALTKSKFKKQ